MVFTKLNVKLLSILIIYIFLGGISVQANDIKYTHQEIEEIAEPNDELPEIILETVGDMNLQVINPVLNPAKNNWLSKEIAKIVLGNDFNTIKELNYKFINYKETNFEGLYQIK